MRYIRTPVSLFDAVSSVGGLIAIFNISILIEWLHQRRYEKELGNDKIAIDENIKVDEYKDKVSFIEFCRILNLTKKLEEDN